MLHALNRLPPLFSGSPGKGERPVVLKVLFSVAIFAHVCGETLSTSGSKVKIQSPLSRPFPLPPLLTRHPALTLCVEWGCSSGPCYAFYLCGLPRMSIRFYQNQYDLVSKEATLFPRTETGSFCCWIWISLLTAVAPTRSFSRAIFRCVK